jgi:hypothetical protein
MQNAKCNCALQCFSFVPAPGLEKTPQNAMFTTGIRDANEAKDG